VREQDDKTARPPGYRPSAHAVGLAIALAAVWLLLSGHFEALLLGFGVLSVAISIFIAMRMDLVDHEGVPVHLTLSALRYLPWLALEVIKANIDVAKRVVDPKLPIEPQLFETKASQRSDLGQTIYANSITLTPGTVAVDLGPGVIRVHAISREGAEALLEGEMDRRVRQLEGRQLEGRQLEGD
jgi:multicomponent Na+:H+ antiporter subunit E